MSGFHGIPGTPRDQVGGGHEPVGGAEAAGEARGERDDARPAAGMQSGRVLGDAAGRDGDVVLVGGCARR